MRRCRYGQAGAATLAMALVLALGASTAQAQAPFEPNDTRATATQLGGPGYFAAAIETDADQDYFRFYIDHPTNISFGVKNTSPGRYSYLDAEIEDADGGTVDSMFLGPGGEQGTVAASLLPGKYFLHFNLRPTGDPPVSYIVYYPGGAVDPATMQAACDRAKGRKAKAKRRVKAARHKLRKATRNGSGAEVRQAMKKLRRAKAKKRKAKRAVRTYCVVG